MNKERCLLEIAKLMKRCDILRAGDCENDFDSQRSFRDDVKIFISRMIADASTWHQAIDNVVFNACSGICDRGYDKRVAQDAFRRGWERVYRILVQLNTKIENSSDDDIRWAIPYEGDAT